MTSEEIDIRVAHSPDSDDVFMFSGLAADRIDTGPHRFTHTLADIETLNRKALKGEYEVTAVSMYVNERTIDYGDEGRSAVQLLLDRAFKKKLIPSAVKVECIP
jgi:predicted solute-binding protein